MMALSELRRWILTLDNRVETGELEAREAAMLKRAARRAYAAEALLRKRARRKVSTEVAAGRLERPRYCESCLTLSPPPESHHAYGYEPENATRTLWLCPVCHDAADRGLS